MNVYLQQMEKFKTCEKEMKTKAYSKEGLSQAAKLDPREKEKAEMSAWLTTAVDSLFTQVNMMEAEIESLELALKKSKKPDVTKVQRKEILENRIETHKSHMDKLEILLRMLENGNISVDSLYSFKDDMEYYVESNGEPDFVEDFAMFDDFDLSENCNGSDSDSVSESEDEELEKIAKEETKPKEDLTAKSAKPALPSVQPKNTVNNFVKPTTSVKKIPAVVTVNSPVTAVLNAATPSTPSEVLSPAKVWSNAPKSLLVEGPKDKKKGKNFLNSDIKVESIPHKPEPSFSEVLSASIKNDHSFASILSQEKEKQSSPDSLSTDFLACNFEDLQKSFEELKIKQLSNAKSEKTFYQQAVENSFMNIPDAIELDRNRKYYPRTPCDVPTSYPSKPPVIFENPAIFERFDIDTLFFIFYYQQKSLQQYFAARELKKQSWRFHKKYLTWFQRHEEPKSITEDFEQGTYIYFDYEGSWCQRKKTEFTFEYRYLEDAELV